MPVGINKECPNKVAGLSSKVVFAIVQAIRPFGGRRERPGRGFLPAHSCPNSEFDRDFRSSGWYAKIPPGLSTAPLPAAAKKVCRGVHRHRCSKSKLHRHSALRPNPGPIYCRLHSQGFLWMECKPPRLASPFPRLVVLAQHCGCPPPPPNAGPWQPKPEANAQPEALRPPYSNLIQRRLPSRLHIAKQNQGSAVFLPFSPNRATH